MKIKLSWSAVEGADHAAVEDVIELDLPRSVALDMCRSVFQGAYQLGIEGDTLEAFTPDERLQIMGPECFREYETEQGRGKLLGD